MLEFCQTQIRLTLIHYRCSISNSIFDFYILSINVGNSSNYCMPAILYVPIFTDGLIKDTSSICPTSILMWTWICDNITPISSTINHTTEEWCSSVSWPKRPVTIEGWCLLHIHMLSDDSRIFYWNRGIEWQTRVGSLVFILSCGKRAFSAQNIAPTLEMRHGIKAFTQIHTCMHCV